MFLLPCHKKHTGAYMASSVVWWTCLVLLRPRYFGIRVLRRALLYGSDWASWTQSQVLHWSHKQSSFILVSHCCHLPLSVHVWFNWKDFPCCHDDVATTLECPYSLSPMCHAVYLWSGVEREGMWIGARSLKNWSCVISFPWDHVWVMKLFEMF